MICNLITLFYASASYPASNSITIYLFLLFSNRSSFSPGPPPPPPLFLSSSPTTSLFIQFPLSQSASVCLAGWNNTLEIYWSKHAVADFDFQLRVFVSHSFNKFALFLWLKSMNQPADESSLEDGNQCRHHCFVMETSKITDIAQVIVPSLCAEKWPNQN